VCIAPDGKPVARLRSVTCHMIKWLNAIVLHRKLISELWSATYRMGSHSVTCHPDTGERAPP